MANTEIPRASDSAKIVVDQNVDVARSLYVPYFEDSDPDVGNNDPDKLGAIASVKSGSGDVEIQVYQGAGVWRPVGSTNSTLIRKHIQITVGTPSYELDLSSETGIPFPSTESLKVNGKSTPATWDFEDKLWSGLPDTNTGDKIDIYFIGEVYVAPPVSDATINNQTSMQILYSKNGGPDTPIQPIQSINLNLNPGDNLSVTVPSGLILTYAIFNADNTVFYNTEINGPGTINGVAYTEGKRQVFETYEPF